MGDSNTPSALSAWRHSRMIFISYRIKDSNDLVDRLATDLMAEFGADAVFRDTSRLKGGDEWPEVIEQQARDCQVMLVAIGSIWHSVQIETGKLKGYLRLHDKKDWVRREIAIGLKAGKIVIPVLLNDAELPDAEWLANFGLRKLHSKQAEPLRTKLYDHDLKNLATVLRRQCPALPTRPATREITTQPGRVPADPARYLRWLSDETSYIDIKGIQVGQEKAHRFPIEDLFISLTTTQLPPEQTAERANLARKGKKLPASEHPVPIERSTVRLEQALQHDRLIVIGDPGSGKTTFLRHIAHALCQYESGDRPQAAADLLGINGRMFPVLVQISELAKHLDVHEKTADAPTGGEPPAWLPHFLGAVAAANHWALDAEFFKQQFAGGRATLLFDGLDEAPNRVLRERVSRLIENVAKSYGKCRIVVTSRPGGYSGAALLSEFAQAQIDPLSDEAVETFLSRWCQALYPESQQAANEHQAELLAALRARPEIRRMARTPVMLTVLAVVHWNERRLPEQRAELYEWVLRWLARSREQKPGRESPERALALLRELALAMQIDPAGFQKQVSQRRAAEMLAHEFVDRVADGGAGHKAIERAAAFLAAEELDSGIVVGRGGQVQFWHRTFQEYLAARAIAARSDARQEELLWGPPARVYLPEWREVMALLAGVLHQQGKDKVDNLVRAMLSRLGKQPTLADEARCAGLLGVMLRDLAPVKYKPPSDDYAALLHRVTAIFDPQRSASVPIETRIESADALGQAGDTRLDSGRDDYWVTIPAGKFLMGAQQANSNEPNYDAAPYKDEAPVHEVQLDEFRIARYLVTVGQYAHFVEDEGYADEQWWSAGGFSKYGSAPEDWDTQSAYPSRPVVGVSWHEAAAYCAWAGFRLPTEAERERAARGAEGRKFPWGNSTADPTRLNYDYNVGHSTPVGIYPLGATPEGICDLAGNVWEWCADWFGVYEAEPVANPRGPEEGSARVVRGGGWTGPARGCRPAHRGAVGPSGRDRDLGFRLLLSPPGQGAEPGVEARREGR